MISIMENEHRVKGLSRVASDDMFDIDSLYDRKTSSDKVASDDKADLDNPYLVRWSNELRRVKEELG